jgi:dynein heavy chain
MYFSLINVQAYWCSAVEECLDGPDPASGLAALYQSNVAQLADLTRLVRGDLSGLARRGLAALITIDVHARDIVGQLSNKGAKSTADFEWQMQLRYYWENDDLVVRQVSSWTEDPACPLFLQHRLAAQH